jgi:hypothetical protein
MLHWVSLLGQPAGRTIHNVRAEPSPVFVHRPQEYHSTVWGHLAIQLRLRGRRGKHRYELHGPELASGVWLSRRLVAHCRDRTPVEVEHDARERDMIYTGMISCRDDHRQCQWPDTDGRFG